MMTRKPAQLWDESIDDADPAPAIRQATVDQREAANPEATAWVAASAGTGKTRVLTNRLLALLLEGAEPRQILALTFTKAAAAEMANRVSESLEKWVTLDDDKLRASLFDLAGDHATDAQIALARRLFAKVLEAPGGLNIQTIHAFAQSLLGRFPVEAGVQPGFKVLEDGEAGALLETAVDRFLIGLSSKDDPAVARVFEVLGEDAFRDIISGLVRERGRLDRLRGANKLPARDILQPLRKHLDLEDDESIEELEVKLIHAEGIPSDLSYALRTYADWFNATNLKRNQNNRVALDAITWMSLDRLEDRQDQAHQYTGLFLTNDGGTRGLGRVFGQKFQDRHPDEFHTILMEQERVVRLANAVKASVQIGVSEALLDTAGVVLDDYEQAKTAISRVDFDDLILKTIELLTAEDGAGLWVSFKLDQGLRHVLVDEAQDTNPDQWDIVRGLTDAFYDGTNGDGAHPRTSFVVGDLKQSIYGFQRADPQVFQGMKSLFEHDVRRSDQHWIAKTLNVTFRSAQPILDAVNAVFDHSDNAQGLTFDGEGWPEHISGRADAGGMVEVWSRIEAPKKPPEERQAVRSDDDLDDDDRPEVELAKLLGERIAKWTDGTARVGQSGWLHKHGRPMRAEDILVLVRSRSGPFINTLTHTLKKAKVKVAGADRMKLQDQLVIKDMLRLTEYLLQPADNLALATVLRSPLCGFTETELFELAHRRDKGETLETALVKAADAGHGPATSALALFQDLRGRLASTPYEFFSFLLTRRDAGRRFSERLGPQAADAVKEFLRASLTFERANTPTITGFLGWLTKADIVVKREQEGEDAGVRIMTVHGSKGLEAPVVILPHTHKRMDDISRDKLRWLETDETPVPYWKPNDKDAPYQLVELAERDKERAVQEERRLLYVAMTRAEERLYICGWKPRNAGKEGVINSWYDTVVDALGAHKDVESFDPGKEAIAEPVFRIQRAPTGETTHTDATTSHSARPITRVSMEQLAALKTAIPQEPSPPKPFTPSQLPEEPASPSPLSALRALQGGGKAARGHKSSSPFFRGNVLHGLLQRLPEIPANAREAAARRYLGRATLELTPGQIEAWTNEVLAITNDDTFADLFGEASRAEVAVTGIVGQMVVSGQIDRLVERDTEVWIVDYKSNRPPPSNPAHVAESYRAQLAAYKAVLGGLYEGKEIRTFLLWTETPRLMEVPVSTEDLPSTAKARGRD